MSSPAATKKNGGFDPNAFLVTIGDGRKILAVPKKQTIFTQGDPADAVFYIQKGKVRLTVISKTGREATIGILDVGSFFGEGALAGQALRMGSAAAMTDCKLLVVEKEAMINAIHREHAFSDLFVEYLLARNIRYEDQSGDPGRDGGHHSFAGQLFHEPLQEIGLHSLCRRSRRRATGSQFPAECSSPRLAFPATLRYSKHGHINHRAAHSNDHHQCQYGI